MSPEELAEARHYAACYYQAGYVHDLMHNFLTHIDQQAARIAELEAQLAALKKIAEEERAKYNLSWKDCAYRAPDTHCEKTHDYCSSVYCPLLEEQKTEANRQLAKEHPEAFR